MLLSYIDNPTRDVFFQGGLTEARCVVEVCMRIAPRDDACVPNDACRMSFQREASEARCVIDICMRFASR